MATPEETNDQPAGGATAQPTPAADQGGNPQAQQGGGDLAAQVVFRFYKSGFVTVMGMDEQEEPIQSLDDAVGIIASVAQQSLPGGNGMEQGAGQPGAQGGGGSFAKGFAKAGGGGMGGMGGKGMM